MVERCRLCGSARTEEFLRRPHVPVHQNLLVPNEQQAIAVPRGDLRMTACRDCGFVFNAAFDPSRLAYGEHYDSTQMCSEVFARHMQDLADHLLSGCGVRGANIVEVGCGKGQFLGLLVAGDAGNSGVGYDPSYTGDSSQLGGRLRFEHRLFVRDCEDVHADVVVCRHVIEHVAEPLELLRSVKRALSCSPNPRLFFETPCVEWILENRVIWDFFYEHCSLFSAASLAWAFRKVGFRVAGVRRLFGAQYLWIEASVHGGDDFSALDGGGVAPMARAFAENFQAALGQWTARVESLARRGQVAIWGAGAKGATFVGLVDPERKKIGCVVDINPDKQGKFIPGTGHLIVSPGELAERGVLTAIVMNPNYLAEAEDLLARLGIRVRLLV